MYAVEYKAGESRYSNRAVDYMMCHAVNRLGDEVTLYAECVPTESETGTYDDLKEAIIEQAEAQQVDRSELAFFYDGGTA